MWLTLALLSLVFLQLGSVKALKFSKHSLASCLPVGNCNCNRVFGSLDTLQASDKLTVSLGGLYLGSITLIWE